MRTTRLVGSVALVIFPAESTGHTERKRTSARLPHAAPFGAAAVLSYSEICAAVLSHLGGTETKGGEVVGRRCYFSRVGSVVALPESTRRAETKPIMANRVGRAPRWQCRFGYLSAGVGCPYGELPNFRTLRRPGRVFSDLYPAAFFSFRRSAAYKCGKQVARRRFFEKVGSVFASPESTPSSANPNHR